MLTMKMTLSKSIILVSVSYNFDTDEVAWDAAAREKEKLRENTNESIGFEPKL